MTRVIPQKFVSGKRPRGAATTPKHAAAPGQLSEADLPDELIFRIRVKSLGEK